MKRLKDIKIGNSAPAVIYNLMLNGSPLDLSGMTGEDIKSQFRLKSSPNTIAEEFIIGSGITILDAPVGKVQRNSFVPSKMKPGDYVNDLRVVYNGKIFNVEPREVTVTDVITK